MTNERNKSAFRFGPPFPALLWLWAVLFVGAPSLAGAAPIVWAVGAGGTIVVSTDLGATWTPQASGTSQDLRGVDFLDALHGVAVGAGGTLLRTTNGGATWSALTSGVTTTLEDVVLSGPNTGVAVGEAGNGTRTTDGGASWAPIVFTSAPDLRALGTTSASTVIAVGDDREWTRSTDNGITWSATSTTGLGGQLPPLNWLGVTGAGGAIALAVGGDPIGGMYTRYDGASWSAPVYIGSFAPTPTAAGFQLSDVAFTGANLVAVGLNGIVTRSNDGGFNWSAPTSVAPFDLFDVEFLDSLTGLAVGAGGEVIRTLDGGLTWTAPIHAAGANLYGLAFAAGDVAAIPEPPGPLLLVVALLALFVAERAGRARSADHHWTGARPRCAIRVAMSDTITRRHGPNDLPSHRWLPGGRAWATHHGIRRTSSKREPVACSRPWVRTRSARRASSCGDSEDSSERSCRP